MWLHACVADCSQTVVVSGSAGAQTTRMGMFEMQPALTAGGKPVYKNSEGQYLYYWPAYLDWLISGDFTKDSAGVTSTSDTDTFCPYDSSGWQEYDGESFVDGSIIVLAGTCPPPW